MNTAADVCRVDCPAVALGRSRTIHRHYALHGKTRYRQTDIPCTVKALDDDRIEVIFDEPVAAVTPASLPSSITVKCASVAVLLSSVCRCRSDYYLYLKQGSSERGKELL